MFLLKPAGIIALVGNAPATIKLEDPAGHIVEEIPVMGHCDHGALIIFQMPFQPADRLGIQMVRRFIKQQQVGLTQQQPAQCHAAAFST